MLNVSVDSDYIAGEMEANIFLSELLGGNK